jgi:hypothetical protein
MAMEAPKQLDLTFTKSVRLLKVRMQRDGTELDIGFNLFAAATNILRFRCLNLKTETMRSIGL